MSSEQSNRTSAVARSSTAMKRRLDIEGLRGVAVGIVLLYHSDAPWFTGGYIGVDMFFVISGYVITRKLQNELDNTGSLDLLGFYGGRMKRLFPGALLVLLFVIFYSILRAQPSHAESDLADGVNASLYSLNMMKALDATSYLHANDDDASYKSPLLHFWSLNIEEQFYLVWPLLVLAFRARSTAFRLVVSLVLSAASFGLSAFLTFAENGLLQPWAFFSPFSRAGQFLFGCMAAQMETVGWLPTSPLTKIFSVLGSFVTLLWAVPSLDSSTKWPGVLAVIPTVCTLFLIWGLSESFDFSSREGRSLSPLQRMHCEKDSKRPKFVSKDTQENRIMEEGVEEREEEEREEEKEEMERRVPIQPSHGNSSGDTPSPRRPLIPPGTSGTPGRSYEHEAQCPPGLKFEEQEGEEEASTGRKSPDRRDTDSGGVSVGVEKERGGGGGPSCPSLPSRAVHIHHWLIERASAPFLVWLGGMSYSLYLWHWPLLLYWQREYPEDSKWPMLVIVTFLSSVPAWAGLHLAENPVRYSRGSWAASGRRVLLVGVGVSVLVVALCYAGMTLKGFGESILLEPLAEEGDGSVSSGSLSVTGSPGGDNRGDLFPQSDEGRETTNGTAASTDETEGQHKSTNPHKTTQEASVKCTHRTVSLAAETDCEDDKLPTPPATASKPQATTKAPPLPAAPPQVTPSATTSIQPAEALPGEEKRLKKATDETLGVIPNFGRVVNSGYPPMKGCMGKRCAKETTSCVVHEPSSAALAADVLAVGDSTMAHLFRNLKKFAVRKNIRIRMNSTSGGLLTSARLGKCTEGWAELVFADIRRFVQKEQQLGGTSGSGSERAVPVQGSTDGTGNKKESAEVTTVPSTSSSDKPAKLVFVSLHDEQQVGFDGWRDLLTSALGGDPSVRVMIFNTTPWGPTMHPNCLRNHRLDERKCVAKFREARSIEEFRKTSETSSRFQLCDFNDFMCTEAATPRPETQNKAAGTRKSFLCHSTFQRRPILADTHHFDVSFTENRDWQAFFDDRLTSCLEKLGVDF
uniref:Acyltransferase 3 domain-containing protein n=1 Tax=Chromera velia CCMP2878 TaxID=1169474 RepID=A0A0G4FMC4_9ALVE|eukprot:Cvel_17576.t1-p1 / transcript=Cvel_17576.t1 / gene=Cvel_17576 / organism=Chromera_velia_CCMP2878 / gene_product=O-acetyltransferase OatA, putative / transcript_product=O-acetyltransferase OatA, putative / location=Cvel_scaffold1412:21543-26260(-) / protein_length=1028 / sequence_SO=supercontig / SO=protein_coding / is_pseudo=false